MDHDDGDSIILEDIDELKTIIFQLGSMFAFTNIPRNLMILSILVSVIGGSTMTGAHYGSDNSDWETINATVIQTGVHDDHCNDLGSLLGDRCRYSGNFPAAYFSWEIEGVTYYSSDFMTYPPNLSTNSQAVMVRPAGAYRRRTIRTILPYLQLHSGTYPHIFEKI